MKPLRDLLSAGLVLLTVAGGTYGLYRWLMEQARRVDDLPVFLYEQPAWSSDESEVAYFRLVARWQPDGSLEVTRRQLCRVGRLERQPKVLADLPPGPIEMLGWVEEDRYILVHPLLGESYRLVEVAADGSRNRRVTFPGQGLACLGLFRDRIYFRRPEEAGVEVVSWRPREPRLRWEFIIPLPAGEAVKVEGIVPSPDGQRAAVVLQVQPPGGPRGLWLYERASGTLRWTTVKSEGCRLELAWSPASTRLVALAGGSDGLEMFILQGDFQTPRRLHTATENRSYRPFWPRGADHFLLVSDSAVYRFDPGDRQARRVLDPHRVGMSLEDLALSPSGGWAAFHHRAGPVDDLYVVGLESGRRTALVPPGPRRQARASLLYRIAAGIRYAVEHWQGGTGRPWWNGFRAGSEKPVVRSREENGERPTAVRL